MAASLASLLSGCTSLTPAALTTAMPWQDEAFGWRADRVTVGAAQLFALDPDLADSLRADEAASRETKDRVDHLIERLFGRNTRPFPYSSNHSTTAQDTWRNGTGDCLSLTVLAYAMARALGLSAQMQEVRVAALFDRRDTLEYVNRHVNLVLRNSEWLHLANGMTTTGSLVLDFEPLLGSRRAGLSLTEAGMLARFYNNVAVEALAQGDLERAYAHFKAAIETDPAFAPSYANLAQLYLRRGLEAPAEALLRRAIEQRDDSHVATHSLRKLLLTQGRSAEAAHFERLLEARQEQDPHHWVARGLHALNEHRIDDAVRAFERAEKLATGFEEVHHYLAIAYWRAGRTQQAQAQVALLASLNLTSTHTAALSRKISGPPH